MMTTCICRQNSQDAAGLKGDFQRRSDDLDQNESLSFVLNGTDADIFFRWPIESHRHRLPLESKTKKLNIEKYSSQITLRLLMPFLCR